VDVIPITGVRMQQLAANVPSGMSRFCMSHADGHIRMPCADVPVWCIAVQGPSASCQVHIASLHNRSLGREPTSSKKSCRKRTQPFWCCLLQVPASMRCLGRPVRV
jgi:hypothetical protein